MKPLVTVDSRLLEDITRRIVEAVEPERIIVFGSAARGEIGPNSDIDLLVIKSGDFHRGRLTAEIYGYLHGVEAAVDVVVVKPKDIEKYGNSPYTVLYPALREGRVLYES